MTNNERYDLIYLFFFISEKSWGRFILVLVVKPWTWSQDVQNRKMAKMKNVNTYNYNSLWYLPNLRYKLTYVTSLTLTPLLCTKHYFTTLVTSVDFHFHTGHEQRSPEWKTITAACVLCLTMNINMCFWPTWPLRSWSGPVFRCKNQLVVLLTFFCRHKHGWKVSSWNGKRRAVSCITAILPSLPLDKKSQLIYLQSECDMKQ